MKIWRGLGMRIVIVSMVSGVLGLIISWGMIRSTTRDAIQAGFGAYIKRTIQGPELARCEQNPESWSLELDRGGRLFAYDATTCVRKIARLRRSILRSTNGWRGASQTPSSSRASAGATMARPCSFEPRRGGRAAWCKRRLHPSPCEGAGFITSCSSEAWWSSRSRRRSASSSWCSRSRAASANSARLRGWSAHPTDTSRPAIPRKTSWAIYRPASIVRMPASGPTLKFAPAAARPGALPGRHRPRSEDPHRVASNGARASRQT